MEGGKKEGTKEGREGQKEKGRKGCKLRDRIREEKA
jgi:hypothetical protein